MFSGPVSKMKMILTGIECPLDSLEDRYENHKLEKLRREDRLGR